MLGGAQPLMGFKLEQTLARLPLDTPEARSAAVRAAVEVLGSDPDPIARHEYAFTAAARFGVDAEVVQRALSEHRPGSGTGDAVGSSRDRDRRLPGHVKVEREALQLLLTDVKEAAPWAGTLKPSDFTTAARRERRCAASTRRW